MSDNDNNLWLFGSPQAVTEITALPFEGELFEAVREVMERHGGNIAIRNDLCLMSFPQGTTKIERLPRVSSERYTITFPDNFKAFETKMRRGISLVGFPLSAFSEEIQQKYAEIVNHRGTSRHCKSCFVIEY